ncbi:MAG: carboxylate--amine ligase, partial [Actinomycetia bacterium]|nr:carboxylate--amine ligase [Actinomycetes bacterium]
ELAGIAELIRVGASYERQRAVAHAHGGALDAVVSSLVAEMRAGRPLGGR